MCEFLVHSDFTHKWCIQGTDPKNYKKGFENWTWYKLPFKYQKISLWHIPWAQQNTITKFKNWTNTGTTAYKRWDRTWRLTPTREIFLVQKQKQKNLPYIQKFNRIQTLIPYYSKCLEYNTELLDIKKRNRKNLNPQRKI